MAVVQVTAIVIEVAYLIYLIVKAINTRRYGIWSWEQGVQLFIHFVVAGIVIGIAVDWLIGKWG